jgi:sporulation protein YlmC with PRC-barrel domain
MTKTNYLALTAALAVLSCGSARIQAQNANSTFRNNNAPATSNEQQSDVTKVNKASSLVGMDVYNLENQKLGDIKDIVLDLHTGKISYVVLSTGGFLGIGEKNIAVPASAFSPSPNDNNLVLNADKAKIQNAPGLTQNNWPDVNNPGFGTISSYWMSSNAGLGTPGLAATGSSSASEKTFHGKIEAVDANAHTMSVKGLTGTQEFKFSARPMINLSNEANAKESDLKQGDSVVVGYHVDNGQYVADTVSQSGHNRNK